MRELRVAREDVHPRRDQVDALSQRLRVGRGRVKVIGVDTLKGDLDMSVACHGRDEPRQSFEYVSERRPRVLMHVDGARTLFVCEGFEQTE